MRCSVSAKAVIVLFFSALTSLAWAHHGWSWYGNEDFVLQATVLEKDFGNPHDRMLVRDEAGNEWNLLLSPPGRSRRAGFSADKVAVGDTITAYGHRRSEGDNFEMKTERLQVGETLYDLYPNRS